MPSPFPGMNPYLEHPHVWNDFHDQFCMVCRTMMLPAIRPKYFCRLNEHIYIHELPTGEDDYVGRGDISIAGESEFSSINVSSATSVAAPVRGRILPQVDVEREVALEIRDRQTNELVTVIELLSPSNKRRGSDRDRFFAKRYQLLESSAHYVEIDLLRAWPRLPVEDLPACDYYALVSRAESRPAVEIWPCQLRQSLPVISVPLRSPDGGIPLDLQAVLQQAFDMGGYDAFVYKQPPVPALSAEDQAWADELLKQASKT